MINVLFLCTGNSARSILSEALMNDLGAGRFKGFSAGSHPSGHPHPDGLAELTRRGHNIEGYSSKSWDVFINDIPMDIVVTVCDNAANEVCPIFPAPKGSAQIKVHWPAPDPAYVEPLSTRQEAFKQVYDMCRARIEALIALSDEALKDQSKVQAIALIG